MRDRVRDAGCDLDKVTVKSPISHIFTKLGLRDRAEAIGYAFDNGLVQPRRP